MARRRGKQRSLTFEVCFSWPCTTVRVAYPQGPVGGFLMTRLGPVGISPPGAAVHLDMWADKTKTEPSSRSIFGGMLDTNPVEIVEI